MSTRKPSPKSPVKKSPFDLGKPGGLEPWLLPFALQWILLPVAGQILHRASEGQPSRLWGPGLLAFLGGVLFWVGMARSQGRRMDARLHLSLSLLWCFWVLAADMIWGSFQQAHGAVWPWVWVLVGGAWAVSWIIPRTESARGTGDDVRTVKGVDLDKLGLAEGTIVTPFPGGATITHAAGETTKDVQSNLTKWASLARLPAGASLRARQGDRQDQTVLEAVPAGSLANVFAWPGPSAPGESIAAPLVTGVMDDGSLFGTADRAHGLEMGMTGSGKTNHSLVRHGEMLTRRDVVCLWNDPIKGLQSAKPIVGHAAWVARDQAEARMMLKRIEAAIPVRAALFGKLGVTEWEPAVFDRHGIPAVHVQFEEAAWLADSALILTLTERARSVGIFITMSLQRASHDRMDTSVRANLSRRFCFGVMDDVSASFCLPDEVLDVGTSPTAWANRRPGMCLPYARDIPDERLGHPFRAFMPSDDGAKEGYKAFGEHLERWAHQRAVLDRTTADALGITVDVPVVAPGFTAPTSTSVEGEDDMPDEATEYAEMETEVDGLESLDLPVEEPVDADTARIARTDDGPDGPDDVDLDDEPELELTTEQRNALFAGVLRGVVKDSRGRPYVLQSEVAAAWMDVPGAKRPWAYHRLERLAAGGFARRDEDDSKVWWLEPGALEADSEDARTPA